LELSTFCLEVLEDLNSLRYADPCTFELDLEAVFQRTSCSAVLQGPTVKVFHDDERLATFFTNVIDRADIGVV
jgi:hypothetical protein